MPRVPFFPEIIFDVIVLGHEADKAFGLMRIEIVHHKVPAPRLGIRGDDVGNECEKVRYSPRGSHRGRYNRALGHIEIGDQRQRRRSGIFELAPLSRPAPWEG